MYQVSMRSLQIVFLTILALWMNPLCHALADKKIHAYQNDGIHLTPTVINGDIVEHFYLEPAAGSKGAETAILLRTNDYVVHMSLDHGNTWKDIPAPDDVVAIYPHAFFSEYAYLITRTDQMVVLTDRGQKISTVKLPVKPVEPGIRNIQYLTFHKSRKDWLIFHGKPDCSGKKAQDQVCEATSYFSNNNGKSWTKMLDGDSGICMFGTGLQKSTDENLIFCDQIYTSNNALHDFHRLVSSTDYFKKNVVTVLNSIIGYAIQDDFIIAASAADDGSNTRVDVSVDGVIFKQIELPHNFVIPLETSYTVLDTSAKAITLHVTTNIKTGSEYGTIVKSNSNGTSYRISIEGVNRDYYGYADFEKMQGLEGIQIVNVVANAEDAREGGSKKLKSMASFNGGGNWNYLTPPSTDSEGKPTCAGSNLEQCSLNLHGYTERVDVRDTYSSASAIGMMIGVGDVGPYITSSRSDGNTYLTSDGGVTWKEIHKGRYMWEYGDQGSIIVLVAENVPTNSILYSYDEGNTWNSQIFYEDVVQVNDITTVPSDTSRNFLIHARPSDIGGSKSLVVNVDFTGTTSKMCTFNADVQKSDFIGWMPRRPGSDSECLFGHQIQYFRKKPESVCYVGSSLPESSLITKNCSCTRNDFECDTNYRPANDGTCTLISGYQPPDHSEDCKSPSVIEYYAPTGYRRIPLTTCDGGLTLDVSTAYPCPGKDNEFNNRHRGIGAIAIFLLILLPVAMSGMVLYVLYNHYYGRYGQIRLGDTDFDTRLDGLENGILKYPIFIASGVIAVAASIPVIVSELFTKWTGRAARPSRMYRGRRAEDVIPLGRRHGYAPVEPSGINVLSDSDDDYSDDDDGLDHANPYRVPQAEREHDDFPPEDEHMILNGSDTSDKSVKPVDASGIAGLDEFAADNDDDAVEFGSPQQASILTPDGSPSIDGDPQAEENQVPKKDGENETQ
ncbi:hypothetical protein V1511DRAFT_306532 [Dipodascopsis uninucleata]